jgi:autotransporter family porin
VTLGFDTADSGTLSVDGGNLSNCDDIFFVGNRGKGTLTITNGGTVTGSISASIASQSGQLWTSNGSVKVDGTNSTWTVSGEADVGGTTTSAGGTGLLTVTNGGTVSAGTSVHVWNSGTLTGNATVSVNSGSGTATVDGTLAPNWTLTTTGNLTFGNAAATMQCNVIPGNLGSVDAEVLGTATLTGIVSVTMTGTFTPGTRFTLLHTSGGRNGKFSSQSINFPTGQGFTPTITYDTNHVYLCLVPNTGGGCN